MRHLCGSFLIPSLLTIALSGCGGPAYRNAEMHAYEPQKGYRFDALKRGSGNTDQVFVCVTFSGGGTRAAALAYGVLQELRDTQVGTGTDAEPHRRLLDEIDMISSVSGGSFTAAGYTLWRDQLFDGRFEHEFLRRNVQLDLIRRVFSFPNLFALPMVALDRIDIVAEYFNDNVFQHRSYGDLLKTGERPLVVVNATNISTGQRFEFTQDDFDILGSDLASLPLGYAVAASQAVPIVLSPLRLKYYPNDVSHKAIRKVLSKPGTRVERTRQQTWASELVPTTAPGEEPSYDIRHENHKYLYLLDGGVSDNLGLSCIIEHYRGGIIRQRLQSKGPDAIRKLVVIVVNAGTKPPEDIEAHESSPGLFMIGLKAAMISVENYSRALIGVVRSALVEESRRICQNYDKYCEMLKACCPDGKPLDPPLEHRFKPYVIEVNFEDTTDARTRAELLALPTNYNLSDAQVDLVIRSGRELLRRNDDFQKLCRDLSLPTASDK